MLLNEPTGVATHTYENVIEGIATDPVPPAHIIPTDGLWKPESQWPSVQGDGNDKQTCSAGAACPRKQYRLQSRLHLLTGSRRGVPCASRCSNRCLFRA